MIHFQSSILNALLMFRQPAGTSRGVYNTRNIRYVKLTSDDQPGKWGIGECAPLPDLSYDALPNYEQILSEACNHLEQNGYLDTERLRPYPSILFGLETAIRHFDTGSFALWDTPFSQGISGIPINGLIWMGDYRKMLEQIEAKMSSGFRCIKLKIGAINFEEELALLKHIRNHFSSKEIELRVDANGAFSPNDAMEKLKRLAELDIHSIEQPIRAGQWEEMARLADNTPLPIALDEELIGNFNLEDKRQLLQTIHPQYIILKPSLHGGFSGSSEWIDEANKHNIGWWVTSALESNIGLNAIAQWCATFNNSLPQGLGTGQLFENNINMPLNIQEDCLWYNPSSNDYPHYPEEISSSTGGKFIFIRDQYPDLQHFLSEWLSDSPTLTVQTSGSTGTPKPMIVDKEKMIQSARLTCTFLNLRKGDKALLCMPLQFIGGKMVVVRAFVAGLELIACTPSGHPLANMKTPVDFAAMTPMQVYNSLQIPEEKERLKQIRILIIGGGAIEPKLRQELKNLPNTVYSTYGMTETLSHIALCRLNGPEASEYYTPFPSVRLSLSTEKTLVIEAPLITAIPILTNDLAEILPNGNFRILGRKDNVINSGGIKIQIEEVEKILHTIIPGDFAITSIPNPQFGEAMVLLIPIGQAVSQELINHLLPSYYQPKYIWEVKDIPHTETNKIDRYACKKLAISLSKSK